MILSQNMNAFNELCKLASKEKWCWKVPCSTCANYDFRYAFLQLAEEKIPNEATWLSTREIEQNKIYNFPHEYSKEVKQSVLKICLESNLSFISDNCLFPDWLGYLGVVMSHMKPRYNENKDSYNKLTRHWAIQLHDMIPQSSAIYKRLESIIANNKHGLNFLDLEACEKVLSGEEAEEIKKREEVRKYNESIAYESLIKIIDNPGLPYSSDVAIYAKQEHVDMLDDTQYEKLCKMYAHLSINANTPWAKFKEKFLLGR